MDLENKLLNLDRKIALKSKIIEEVYENNIKNIENYHENILSQINQYRQELIDKVNQRLNSDINCINEFSAEIIHEFIKKRKIATKKSDLVLRAAKTRFKMKMNRVKYYDFKKSKFFNYNLLKNNHKLISNISFINSKNKSFTSVQKQIKLNHLEKCSLLYLKYDTSGIPVYFINIPFNNIFINVSIDEYNRTMFIINENGLVLHSAKSKARKEIFDASPLHIIRLLLDDSEVFIYNFELELYHNFKLDIINDHTYMRISISYNEYSFFGCPNKKICVYDYKNMKQSYINLQSNKTKDPFFILNERNDMLHMSYDRLYFLNYIPYQNDHINTIYMIDRKTGQMLENRMNIFNKSDLGPTITFDDDSNICLYYSQKCIYSIYNSNFKFIFSIDELGNCLLFAHFCFKYFSNGYYDKSENSIKFIKHYAIKN